MAARPQTETCGNCRGRSGSLSEIMQIVTSAVRVLWRLTKEKNGGLDNRGWTPGHPPADWFPLPDAVAEAFGLPPICLPAVSFLMSLEQL